MPELQEKPADSQPSAGAPKQAFFRLDSGPQRTLWVLLFLTAGLVLRVWHASGTFLNSDEIMHFAAANQTSWAATYRMSLAISHPPLLIFVLHLWRALGTSELMLRMSSIIAGLAFCWFALQWARLLFAEEVAWGLYVFVLFLPTSIELSTEVRQYALFLAFMMAAAYLLERALAENSAGAMLLSGVSLWFAIGSHYSGFLFAPALGVYAIWRILRQGHRLRVTLAWVAGQVGALALCIFLYFTQIRELSHYFGGQDPTKGWMENAYLGHSYFVSGKVNPVIFIIGRTVGVFQYTFRQLVVGDIAFLFFLAGIFLLFRGKNSSRVNSRQLGALLLLPFAANCAAAMVRAYPYGGTRHSSFLLPFALAGICIALAGALRHKLLPTIATAIAICLLCRLTLANKPPFFSSTDERASNMHAAIDYIDRLPEDEIIFGDFQTNLMLGHYLCNQQPYAPDQRVPGFVSFQCGGHRVIASTTKYVFDANSFYDQIEKAAFRFGLRPGSTVQVAQMGWNTHLVSEIGNSGVVPHSFGSELHLFEFTVPQSGPAILPKL
ncbi:MAG TPA: glycosyltransferase family 39 protein [Terriglobales bacterium]|nr:glycosyltransferase family 39 protein [Terriglobales bacterium]